MTTYFVNAEGSNTSPWDTPAKGAPNFSTVGASLQSGDVVETVYSSTPITSGAYYPTTGVTYRSYGTDGTDREVNKPEYVTSGRSAFSFANKSDITIQNLDISTVDPGGFNLFSYSGNISNIEVSGCFLDRSVGNSDVGYSIMGFLGSTPGDQMQNINIFNNVLKNNLTGRGIVFDIRGSGSQIGEVNIFNNVFYNIYNIVVGTWAYSGGSYGTLRAYNNILKDCGGSFDNRFSRGYNCFHNSGSPTPQTGDVFADPLFVNASGGDFRLQATSPCLDQGIGIATQSLVPTTDTWGNPRPQSIPDVVSADDGMDMGVYEAQAPSFELSTPYLDNYQLDGADINVRANIDCIAYMVMVPYNDTSPTKQEIINGTASGGGAALDAQNLSLSASTLDQFVVTGESPNMYDIYVVLEDQTYNMPGAIGDIRLDIQVPAWTATYPKLANLAPTSVDILLSVDEDGTGYTVVVPSGSSTPTAQEVKDGQSSGGGTPSFSGNTSVSADTEASINITGLVTGTYDVYSIVEDTIPNLQVTPAYNEAVLDSTPPSWESGYPNISNIVTNGSTETSFYINLQTNENGVGYSVVVPFDDSAPTSTEVKNGQGSGGSVPTFSGNTSLIAYTEGYISVSNVAPSSYYIYSVAEDINGPNLQVNPVYNVLDVPYISLDTASGVAGSSATVSSNNFELVESILHHTFQGSDGAEYSQTGPGAFTEGASFVVTTNGGNTATHTLTSPLENNFIIDFKGVYNTENGTKSNGSISVRIEMSDGAIYGFDISDRSHMTNFLHRSLIFDGETEDSYADSLTETTISSLRMQRQDTDLIFSEKIESGDTYSIVDIKTVPDSTTLTKIVLVSDEDVVGHIHYPGESTRPRGLDEIEIIDQASLVFDTEPVVPDTQTSDSYEFTVPGLPPDDYYIYLTTGNGTSTYIEYELEGNSAPTGITLSSDYILEGSPNETLVGYLSAEDPNLPGDSHNFYLAYDDDENFYIWNSNELRLLDTESVRYVEAKTRYVEIQAMDLHGADYIEGFYINVGDDPTLPAIINSFTGIAMNRSESEEEQIVNGLNFIDGGDPTVYINGEVIEPNSFTNRTININVPDGLDYGKHTLKVLNGNNL